MPEDSVRVQLPGETLVIKLLSASKALGTMDHRALGGTFCVKEEEKCSNQLNQ